MGLPMSGTSFPAHFMLRPQVGRWLLSKALAARSIGLTSDSAPCTAPTLHVKPLLVALLSGRNTSNTCLCRPCQVEGMEWLVDAFNGGELTALQDAEELLGRLMGYEVRQMLVTRTYGRGSDSGCVSLPWRVGNSFTTARVRPRATTCPACHPTATSSQVKLDPRFVSADAPPLSSRAFLLRLLNNLRQIYVTLNMSEEALSIVRCVDIWGGWLALGGAALLH